jgi:glycosyltransferase involved in cell wall biosynthesis
VMRFQPHLVDVVPPGIGEQFRPGDEKSPTPLVVAVGRLMPTKQFDETIRIVAAVRERQPTVELVIAGDGYEREHLEALVAELGAESYIHFAGYVSEEEKVRLYQQAWVVVSASIAEGWGMTLTEANACGTPVVASRIPGHQDAVAEDSSGLLGVTSAEMVDHIDAIIADEGLRERLAKGALEHAATLTWDAASHRVFSLLAAQAVARNRRR